MVKTLGVRAGMSVMTGQTLAALVGHTDFFEAVARDNAVGADETEHAGEHLIGGCPVMAVDDNDLSGLGLGDLFIPPQAQHMLGMAVAAAIARNRLDGEERLPAFPA